MYDYPAATQHSLSVLILNQQAMVITHILCVQYICDYTLSLFPSSPFPPSLLLPRSTVAFAREVSENKAIDDSLNKLEDMLTGSASHDQFSATRKGGGAGGVTERARAASSEVSQWCTCTCTCTTYYMYMCIKHVQ